MTRLPGWRYRGPDPDGYLAAGEFVDHLEAYAAVVRRARRRRDDESAVAVLVGRRRARYRVVTDARHLARPPRRHRDRAARAPARARRARPARRRRAHRPAHYRNPGQLPAGRRARRRRLGVGRADRRRAQPRRPRRRARRRPAHPDAAPLPRHGHLLVARAHRPARPDHRRRARPGGRARASRRSSSSAATPDGPRRTSTWRPPGTRRPAGRAARPRSTARGCDFARRPGRHRRATPTRRLRRFLDAVDDYVDEYRPGPPSCWRPNGRARARSRARRAGSTCAPRASAPSCSRPASARTTPGCGCRSPTPDGEIRQYRGVTAAPGLYVVGQRFQHRRDSALIDGARHDAARSWPTCSRGDHGRWRRRCAGPSRPCRDERRTTSSWSAAGSPAPRPPCCWPGPACGCAVVDRGRPAATPLSTHAPDACRRPPAVALGTARPTSSRPGTPPSAHRLPLRRRRAARRSSIRPQRGVDALYAPRRTCSTGSSSTPPREAGADVLHGDRVTDLRPRRRPAAWPACARRAGPVRRDAHGRGSPSAPTASAPSSPTRPAPPSCGRVGTRARCSYRYVEDLPADGYEWAYGDGAAAGLIPTNDGRPASSSAPPRADAAAAPVGADAGLRHAARPGGAWPLADRVPRRTAGQPVRGWGGAPGLRPPVLGTRVGAGRRRRLLQGPDHHARHDRRLARRRAARRRGRSRLARQRAPERGRRWRAYQETARPAVARALRRPPRQVAAYDWDADHASACCARVSSAMSDEVDHLEAARCERGRRRELGSATQRPHVGSVAATARGPAWAGRRGAVMSVQRRAARRLRGRRATACPSPPTPGRAARPPRSSRFSPSAAAAGCTASR